MAIKVILDNGNEMMTGKGAFNKLKEKMDTMKSEEDHKKEMEKYNPNMRWNTGRTPKKKKRKPRGKKTHRKK